MKFLKTWAIAALLCVVSAVSFYGGRYYEYSYFGKKDYEAACLQADFIRYLIDHFDGETECANIGSEIDECYYEYFTDIDAGIFKTEGIKDIKDFEDYYWCY